MPYVRPFLQTVQQLTAEIDQAAAPEAVRAALEVIAASAAARDNIALFEGRSKQSSKWYRTETISRAAVTACSDLLTLEGVQLKAVLPFISNRLQSVISARNAEAQKQYEKALQIKEQDQTRLTWQRLTAYFNSLLPVLVQMRDSAEHFAAAAGAALDADVFRVYQTAAETFCAVLLDLTAPDLTSDKSKEKTEGIKGQVVRQIITPVKDLKLKGYSAYALFRERTTARPEPEDPAPMNAADPEERTEGQTCLPASAGSTAAEGKSKRGRGRPKDMTPRKRYSFVLTEQQYEAVRDFISNLRG